MEQELRFTRTELIAALARMDEIGGDDPLFNELDSARGEKAQELGADIIIKYLNEAN